MRELSASQEAFCQFIAVGLRPSEAYARSHLGALSAEAQRLLKHPLISVRIERLRHADRMIRHPMHSAVKEKISEILDGTVDDEVAHRIDRVWSELEAYLERAGKAEWRQEGKYRGGGQ